MSAVSPEAKAKQKAAKEAYAKSPRGKYSMRKSQAKARGIEFLLTFEDWWQVWQDSGHYDQMGKGLDDYCMGRKGDVGPYAVGNVEIVLVRTNLKDQIKNGRHVTACLTNEQVASILKMCSEGVPQVVAAKQFGIRPNHVWRLINGHRGSLSME